MKRSLQIILTLATAGLIFSGYLSAVKLLNGSCAFNETCPYFLGYPSCWYGFAMYLAMVIATGLAVLNNARPLSVLTIDSAISALGIVFAGSFVIQEVAQGSLTGTLGLSTCAYGLIFYIAIFITSLWARKHSSRDV